MTEIQDTAGAIDVALEAVGADLEVRQAAIQLLLELEAAGAADAVSLTLTDRDMPYQRWEDLGRFLGELDRRSRWYLGDWLNFGEEVYGEDSAQGTDSTLKERYDLAERVTGLDHGTLINIRTVCGKVARSRRRRELGFWIHSEVTALEADEQVEWLQRAIDEGWGKAELRAAIKEAKNPAAPSDPGPAPEPGLSLAERIENAARLVYHQSQPDSDGNYIVPPEPMAQLAAALGEE